MTILTSQLTAAQTSILVTETSDSFNVASRMRGPTWSEKVSTTLPSKGGFNLNAWMNALSPMEKWKGPLRFDNIEVPTWRVPNEPYGIGFAADQFEYEDFDAMAATVIQLAADNGANIGKFFDYQFVELFDKNAGFGPTLWDKVPMFDLLHPVNIFEPALGTYANVYDLALTPDNFRAVRTEMRKRPLPNGKRMGVRKLVLGVPPDLEQIAEVVLLAPSIATQLFAGQTMVGANTNVNNGPSIMRPALADIVVFEDWDSTTGWMLLEVGKGVMPFARWNREAPTIVPNVSPTAPNVFYNHRLEWKVWARQAFSGTLPYLASLSDPGLSLMLSRFSRQVNGLKGSPLAAKAAVRDARKTMRAEVRKARGADEAKAKAIVTLA